MRDDQASELSERDRRILDFEQDAPLGASRKEVAIHEQLGLTGLRYQQLLGSLIEKPAALAYAPMLVGRLIRLRDARTEARRARRFGAGSSGVHSPGPRASSTRTSGHPTR